MFRIEINAKRILCTVAALCLIHLSSSPDAWGRKGQQVGPGSRIGTVKVKGITYKVKRFRWGPNRARGIAIDGIKVLGNGKAIMDSRTAPSLVQRLGGKINNVQPAKNRSFIVSYSLRVPGTGSLLERVEQVLSRGPKNKVTAPPKGKIPGRATERFVVGDRSRVKTDRITGIQVTTHVLVGEAAGQSDYAKKGWKRHPDRSYDSWLQMPAGSY